MANEPRFTLRQVTARIELDDYAKVIQTVDAMKDENGQPVYKDVSTLVREAIHEYVKETSLDEQHVEWVAEEKRKNIERRNANREKRRGFFRRMFFR